MCSSAVPLQLLWSPEPLDRMTGASLVFLLWREAVCYCLDTLQGLCCLGWGEVSNVALFGELLIPEFCCCLPSPSQNHSPPLLLYSAPSLFPYPSSSLLPPLLFNINLRFSILPEDEAV